MLGPYRIASALGAGGMGEVYLAKDTRLHRTVAIKVLLRDSISNPDRRRRFLKEARAASALNHPNIVVVYDISSDAEVDFIVLEHIRGKTLEEIGRSGRVPANTLAAYGAQAARALAAAHAAGIIHRDIKPSNIMVTPESVVKILDFGLAKVARPPSSDADQGQLAQENTAPGFVLGTPAYMSPEQARGEPLDGQSDVFSLAVVLYELATAVHPFRKAHGLNTFHAIVSDAPEQPSRLNPEFPQAFESLLLAMLEKNPRRRPSAEAVATALADPTVGALPPSPGRAITHVVGRDRERDQMRRLYAEACSGRGSMVCVSGEPGLGKTTLVDEFIQTIPEAVVARGRCSERLAGTDAYLPVLEILSDILRRSDPLLGASRIMRTAARTWYSQIASAPLDDSTATDEHRKTWPALTQERMKREIVELFEGLCHRRTVVLILEDLHWADLSTVDLLSYLGNRAATMRLLLLVTYRPSDLAASKHPFRHVKLELQGRRLAHELTLDFLDHPAVVEYLELEFPDHRFPAGFAQLVHSRTEGHPLFMAELLRDLRDRGLIARPDGLWQLTSAVSMIEADLPASVQSLIERKIDVVPEEGQTVLTAAAVQGWQFDSAVVAAALELTPDRVEERLRELDRVHGLLKPAVEHDLPDGTINTRYRFVHSLYQNAFLRRATASARARLSLRIAQRLEAFHAVNTSAVAAELAYLFEQGRNFASASLYFLAAARNAARVFGHQEAIALALEGLRCLERLPDTPGKAADELALLLVLAGALMVTRGFGDPEAPPALRRARELCRQYSLPGQVTALRGVFSFHFVRAEFSAATEVANELFALAEATGDPVARIEAHFAMGFTSMYTGDLAGSEENFEAALRIPDPRVEPEAIVFALHHAMACRGQLGIVAWILGYPDRALTLAGEAKAEAERRGSPYDIGWAVMTLGRVHALRGEGGAGPAPDRGRSGARAGAWVPGSGALGPCHPRRRTIRVGRAAESLGENEAGVKIRNQTGSRINSTEAAARVVECLAMLGRPDDGFAAAVESIEGDVANGERFYEAELRRLAGECRLSQGKSADAEACFRQALEAARSMRARAWELRAAISIGGLLQSQGRRDEAREILSRICDQYTEGFETKDLRRGRALLHAFTGSSNSPSDP